MKVTNEFSLSPNFCTSVTDLLEDVGEIGEILGRSYGTPDGIDEDDLDAELACLEDEFEIQEDVSTSLPSSATIIPPAPQSGMPAYLPQPPVQQPSQQQQQQPAPPTVIPASNSLI